MQREIKFSREQLAACASHVILGYFFCGRSQVKEEKVEQEKNRYKVRPLRNFSSAFEKRQIATEKAKIESERQKKEEEKAAKIAVRINDL